MEQQSKRILYLDFLKVMAIIGVIAIHVVQPDVIWGMKNPEMWWASNIINNVVRWAVPVFFMISGVLILNDSRVDDSLSYIGKKFVVIGIPFLLWSVIYSAFKHFYIQKEAFDLVSYIGVVIYEMIYNEAYVHLWFIYDLFILYLISPFLRKIVKNSTSKELAYWLTLWFITSVVHLMINQSVVLFELELPSYMKLFDYPMVFGFGGFYVLGYFLDTVTLSKKIRKYIYSLGVVAVLVGTVGTWCLSQWKGILIENFYGNFSLTTLLSAVAIFVFIKYRDIDGKLNTGMQRLIVAISKASFGIYIIHQFFVLGFANELSMLHHSWGFPVYYMIAILGTLLGSCFLVKLVKLIPKIGKYII